MKEVRAVLQRADEAVQQGFDCLTGPRLKVRPFTPAHRPFVVGIAKPVAGQFDLIVNYESVYNPDYGPVVGTHINRDDYDR